MRHPARLVLATTTMLLVGIALVTTASRRAPGSPVTTDSEPHRSPIALALSADGTRLLSANQTSGSVSLIDTKAGTVLHEIPTGDKPAGVALSQDGRRGVVTHWYGYDLAVLDVGRDRLKVVGRV